MKYDEEMVLEVFEILSRVMEINRKIKEPDLHQINFWLAGGEYPNLEVRFVNWKPNSRYEQESVLEFRLYLLEKRFYDDKRVLPSLRLKLDEWEEKYCEKEQEE